MPTSEAPTEALRLVEHRTIQPQPSNIDRSLEPQPTRPEPEEVKEEDRSVPQYSKAFRYDFAATNIAAFPSLEYTICEPAPYVAGVNPLERGAHVRLEGTDAQTVTTTGPYSGAKGNVCMRGGEWYFEIEVIRPNVRIGIARRETSCEGPVGADSYSYGVQDGAGTALHCARPRRFMQPFGPGDVIGFHVCIPRDSRPIGTVRSRVPLKYNDQIWLESLNYRSSLEMERYILPQHYGDPKPNEIISGSFVKVFRNGEYAGTLAEPLRDFSSPLSKFDYWLHLKPVDDGWLGYYPMISVYKGGAARFNFGPHFNHTAPESARGLWERYNEQVADDVAVDAINEIVFEEIDAEIPRQEDVRQRLQVFEEKKVPAKKLF